MTTSKWVIDPLHSEIQFKVKHLVISTVTGNFNSFGGRAVTDGDEFENASIVFDIDVNSINTNQPGRDEHLKSPDFFEAATYPEIKFTSTSFKKTDTDKYKLLGDLTMKNITNPVELEAEYGGSAKDMYGNVKYGFEVTGKINRKQFGLTYNALTETGGLALGEDIRLIANIQLLKEA